MVKQFDNIDIKKQSGLLFVSSNQKILLINCNQILKINCHDEKKKRQ